MKQDVSWLEHEVTYVRENYLNLSMSQMGAHLGKTRNAVIGKLSRMGLKKGLPRSRVARLGPPRQRKVRAKKTTSTAAVSTPIFEQVFLEPAGKNACSQLELTEESCRWMHDESFCNEKVLPKKPYCGYHAKIVYAPPRERTVAPWRTRWKRGSE